MLKKITCISLAGLVLTGAFAGGVVVMKNRANGVIAEEKQKANDLGYNSGFEDGYKSGTENGSSSLSPNFMSLLSAGQKTYLSDGTVVLYSSTNNNGLCLLNNSGQVIEVFSSGNFEQFPVHSYSDDIFRQYDGDVYLLKSDGSFETILKNVSNISYWGCDAGGSDVVVVDEESNCYIYNFETKEKTELTSGVEMCDYLLFDENSNEWLVKLYKADSVEFFDFTGQKIMTLPLKAEPSFIRQFNTAHDSTSYLAYSDFYNSENGSGQCIWFTQNGEVVFEKIFEEYLEFYGENIIFNTEGLPIIRNMNDLDNQKLLITRCVDGEWSMVEMSTNNFCGTVFGYLADGEIDCVKKIIAWVNGEEIDVLEVDGHGGATEIQILSHEDRTLTYIADGETVVHVFEEVG